jgi:glycosyltransferase involved in cell wall biosynthesis
MNTTRSLSVVIACYRDAGSVREFYRRLTEVLPSVTPDYEIVYVNDASPDNAEHILTELAAADPRLVVVNHTRNFGSQNAFLSGMQVSRGDAVILMDGDLQDPPALIPDLVAKWLLGFDIVYGVRVRREESVLRQAARKAFYRLFRRLADFRIPVDAGDFGLMDRKVVDTLLHQFPEQVLFLRGLRAYTGFRHTGVEYVRQARFDGRSTNSLARNIRWARLAIFSFSHRPLDYISALAFSCVWLTLALGVFYVGAYFFGGRRAPSGFMTLLLVVMFLGSVQLVCVSILAEYLGHIFEEIKRRPRFIVRDVVDNRPSLSASRGAANDGAMNEIAKRPPEGGVQRPSLR